MATQPSCSAPHSASSANPYRNRKPLSHWFLAKIPGLALIGLAVLLTIPESSPVATANTVLIGCHRSNAHLWKRGVK